MNINEILKQTRKLKKITQKELSEQTGIPYANYNKYETTSTTPDIETLIKLADYYNVSLDYLVGRQHTNEIGYLDKQQTIAVQAYLKLNPANQRNVEIFILNTLAKQF